MAPSQTDNSSDNQAVTSSKKRLLFIISLFTVFGIIVGTGIGVYLTRNKQTKTEDKSATNSRLASKDEEVLPSQTDATTPSITVSPIATIKQGTYSRLALGDGKYTSSGGKKGYIYVCEDNFNKNGGGAGKDGPWIDGDSWDPTKKPSVQGNVNWPNAKITITKDGTKRTFTTNDLPTTHNTGTYPIVSSDPAHEYDANPNKISAQQYSFSLTLNPTTGTKPQCVRGTVGIMLTGVLLFDGLDAEGRDAPAHELQDACDGHPEKTGSYHYHALSDCISDGKSNKLIGYAWDGFGIYGSFDSNGKELMTDDLDECHGTTSDVEWEGKKVSMYHYVMTKDYPYSVGCFKGSSVYREQPQQMQGMQQPGGNKMPPPPMR